MSEANGFASGAELLEAGKRRYGVVELPSGLKVRLRSLTQLEVGRTNDHIKPTKNEEKEREQWDISAARLIIACAVDGEGKPLFSDPDDIDAVRSLDFSVGGVLVAEVNKHLGLTKSVEKLVKNSDAIGSDASPSS